MIPVDALLDRLVELERRLGGGGSPGGSGTPRPAPRGGPSGHAREGGPPPARGAEAPDRQGAVPQQRAEHAAPMTIARSSTSFAGAAVASSVDHAPNSAPRSAPPSSSAVPFVIATSESLTQPEEMLATEVVAHVRAIIARLREQRPTWGSLLEHGVVMRCDGGGFDVAYEKRSFLAAQVSDRAVAEAFARAALAELTAPTRILVCDVPPRGRSLAAQATQQKNAALDAARESARTHPAVRDALEIFGAEVRSVKVPGDE